MARLIKLIPPTQIPQIAESFDYDPVLFTDFERALQTSIRAYAPPYGQKVFEHLERSAFRLEDYLRKHTQGLSDTAITNIVRAFRFHDGGKTMQSPELWNLEEAPKKGDPRREERKKHCDLIVPWLEDQLKSFPKIPKTHPYLLLIVCFGTFHHERIDGRGPKGLKGQDLGTILEIAGIVDAADGKEGPKPNKPTRSEAEALREMTGNPRYTQKNTHAGEFNVPLLLHYIQHRQAFCNEPILRELQPPLAQPVIS